ncbi:MAG: ABC transporter substrate-binding protein [Treponema sp.]|nr:ABC transporter substrate-binding protein [Treponema sp.]
MKKMVLIVVVSIVLGICLVSCGGSSSKEAKGEETYKITMMLLSAGTTPDVGLVQVAINDYIKPMGLELEFAIMDWQFVQTINLMVSGGEKLDLIPVWGTDMSNDIAQGKILPLTPYLDTVMAGTKEIMKDYLVATTYREDVYGVPTLRDMAAAFGICMREDIMTKYGYKIEDIKTPADLEAMFIDIAPKEPELYMFYTQGNGNDIIEQMLHDWDPLGNDAYGVLMNYGQEEPLKVVNLFDTPEYEGHARLLRKWYLNGWIVPDATTNPQGGPVQVGAEKLFGFASNLKPGFDAQSTLAAGGVKMVQSSFKPQLSHSQYIALINWCIPMTCKNPEKTAQFLNLLFTDPVVFNLINWGIEGRHYVKMNDHIITYPEGVTAETTGYNMNLTWFYGNSLIGYMWEGNDYDVNDQMREFNRTAIFSKATGFNFDTTPVRNAITSVTNVVNEYRLAMGAGMLDVDENLPKFRAALKAAGIDEIVAEKQRQLDAWLAAR